MRVRTFSLLADQRQHVKFLYTSAQFLLGRLAKLAIKQPESLGVTFRLNPNEILGGLTAFFPLVRWMPRLLAMLRRQR